MTPLGGCFLFPAFTFTLVTFMVAKLSVYARTDRNSDTRIVRLAELVSPSGEVQ
jgi:hypothetical protein